MKLKHKLERLQLSSLGGSAPREPALPARAEAPPAPELTAAAQPSTPDAPELHRSEDRLSKLASLRSQLERMRMAVDSSPARRAATPALPYARSVEAPERVAPRPVQLPGEYVESAHGALCRKVVIHDLDHRHGSAHVRFGCHARGADVALLSLDESLLHCDFSRALYIDTETTGLAGGAGTLPFLIGMAWFEQEQLVVEQLFLPRPGLEGPMLGRLAERMAEASVIVSYNGKSFDWPLLRTRFILNRVAAPKLSGHLDLLHCARRVYKARLGSVRLLHLEQELLGFERVDDIAGELIPETYLAFLRGARCGTTLTPILDHNRSDLVALPALLGELLRRFTGEHGRQDARDALGFAKVAARGAAPERALAFAHAAAEADVRGELAGAALYLVGELKLGQGDWEGASAAFEAALEASASRDERARCHLALAKLHEHRSRQLARALSHAQHTTACEGEEASARRCLRLAARLARSERVRAPRAP